MHVVLRKQFNFEAEASEFIENLEGMFLVNDKSYRREKGDMNATGDTLSCGQNFDAIHIILHVVPRKYFFIFLVILKRQNDKKSIKKCFIHEEMLVDGREYIICHQNSSSLKG